MRVDDVIGNVEQALACARPRFRTIDRSLVTIPNNKLADEDRVHTSARSPAAVFRSASRTTPSVELLELRDALSVYVKVIPRSGPLPVRVHLTGFGESALTLRIMAWFDEVKLGIVWVWKSRHGVMLQVIPDHRAARRTGSRSNPHFSCRPAKKLKGSVCSPRTLAKVASHFRLSI